MEDSRSVAHEALRPMLASLGGDSYTGLKIHPSPNSWAMCQPDLSLEKKTRKKKKRGGQRGRRKKHVSTTGPQNSFQCQQFYTLDTRRQIMCQLGWNKACVTIDGTGHVLHITRVLEDEITSLARCVTRYTRQLLYLAYLALKHNYFSLGVKNLLHEITLKSVWADCSAPPMLSSCFI